MSVWVLIIRDPGACHVQTGPRTCKGSKIRTRIQEMPGPGQGYSVHWLYCSLQNGGRARHVRYSHWEL